MNNGYKGTIIISIIMSLILVVVAFFSWPNKDINQKSYNKTIQSNEKDESKTQIEIIVKRINIREDKTIESKDVGDVYQGEIYTVLEDYEDEEYYWYKIKTDTDITGYIASLKSDEYVKLLSGYIDRTAPVIEYDKDFYILDKDDDFSKITCKDEYSKCSMTITKDDLYLYVSAKDEKENETKKTIRYYVVYEGGNYFTEWNDYLTIDYRRTLNQDNSMSISATYVLKKWIKSSNKSSSYNVSVNMYDENFNVIESIYSKYNIEELDLSCKNDKYMNIKEEYINDDLNIGDKLCFNFYTPDHTSVKYYEITLSGIDNVDKNDNYLRSYSSRLIIK